VQTQRLGGIPTTTAIYEVSVNSGLGRPNHPKFFDRILTQHTN